MNSEKFVFPNSLQKDILGLMSQDKQFLRETLGILKPEFFEKNLYMLCAQSIYKIFLETRHLPTKPILLHELSQSLSKEVRVKDQEQKQNLIVHPVQKLLKEIYKPLNGSEAYVRKEVIRFCKVQGLKRTFLECYEDLEKNPDPEAIHEQLGKKLRQLSTMSHGGSDFFEGIDGLPASLFHDKSRCISTGFPSLDKMMDGGMDPGTLTVFMAPSKFGKSMALVNVGYDNLLRKKKVMHFTLEISEKKIMKRYAARISKIRDIGTHGAKVIKRVKKFHQLHRGTLKVKGYPTKTASVETLRGHLYHLQNQQDFVPDVVIVDYGDILRSTSYSKDKSGEGERFIQGDVYEGLRAMGQEFDCAIVTASQTNRAAATKPIIRMEDVAESYAKVQAADHIISICGTDEERKENRLRLFFAGSREAESQKMIRIRFNWKIALMKEVPKEEMGSDE